MDSYHVFWLLDELQTLTQKHVITEEVARRIEAYYAPASEPRLPEARAAAPSPLDPPQAAGDKESGKTGTSIYADIRDGRRTEVDTISGSVVCEELRPRWSVRRTFLSC